MSSKRADSPLTAEERRQAVATILARGVLRVPSPRYAAGTGPRQNSPDFPPEGLEVLGKPSRFTTSRMAPFKNHSLSISLHI